MGYQSPDHGQQPPTYLKVRRTRDQTTHKYPALDNLDNCQSDLQGLLSWCWESKVSAYFQQVPGSFYLCKEALKGPAAAGQAAERRLPSAHQRGKAPGMVESRAHAVAAETAAWCTV